MIRSPDLAIHHLTERLWEWKSKGLIQSILINPWPHYSDRHIAELLGYDTYTEVLNGWTTDTYRTLELLCGPDGWVYYKALLAQRGMDVSK